MVDPICISQKEARRIALYSQGFIKKWNNSLEAIQQLGYVQIDTISVTERSHNHVMFTRNPNFEQSDLNKLMDEKSIFEYWSHAAAYLPIEDFRFSLLKKEHYKNGTKHWWFSRDNNVEKYVLDRIKSEGPLQSKDFISPKGHKNDWYNWKPSKTALSNLFMDGSIMIANRKGFQKVFDLTERVLPITVDTAIPSIKEYCEHLIKKAIKANGLVTLNEIGYLRKGMRPTLKLVISEFLESGQIIPITVNGNLNTYYSNMKIVTLLHKVDINLNEVHILNPFDNIMIQRKRIKELFNFDYHIECYVPEVKRIFGYYTLSVLYGNKFVMRFDAKADRKKGVFIIKGFWYEKGYKPTGLFLKKFNKKLEEFALFCGCDSVNKFI